ncbi:MAG TPA: hypothetical protein VI277_07020, partial [Candidatus Limnocylindria bacterium]
MTSPHRLQVWNTALCAAVALIGGVAAAIGIFARGDGTFETVTSARGEVYEMATTGVYAFNARQVVAEGVGWDVFTLVIAVPALLIAALLVARGSFRGHLLAAGMLGYFLYMYLEYAVTWAFGPLFVLFVILVAASLVGLIGIASALGEFGLEGRFTEEFPRRTWAALSVAMSLLLVAMWASRIAQALGGEIEGVLHGETTMTVQALDLGLMVPLSLLIAVQAWRRSPVAIAAAAAFAVTFVAMSSAIASMMVSASIVSGTLQLPPILIFGLAVIAGGLVAARMYSSVDSPHAQVQRPQPALRIGS